MDDQPEEGLYEEDSLNGPLVLTPSLRDKRGGRTARGAQLSLSSSTEHFSHII